MKLMPTPYVGYHNRQKGAHEQYAQKAVSTASGGVSIRRPAGVALARIRKLSLLYPSIENSIIIQWPSRPKLSLLRARHSIITQLLFHCDQHAFESWRSRVSRVASTTTCRMSSYRLVRLNNIKTRQNMRSLSWQQWPEWLINVWSTNDERRRLVIEMLGRGWHADQS